MGCGLIFSSSFIAYWIAHFGIEVHFFPSAFDKRGFLSMNHILQAIKVLNMIKLYGKPIRVNKVQNTIFLSHDLLYFFCWVFVQMMFVKSKSVQQFSLQGPVCFCDFSGLWMVFNVNVHWSGIPRQKELRCGGKSFYWKPWSCKLLYFLDSV